MNVTFYNFTKEENSTKRPSDGTLFDCQIKRGSGLMNPAIELNIGLTQAPEYNYCYIPDFKRFYYVTEWYFDTGFWTASLSCDVLATYRSEIGSADLYALRSANNWDSRIVDNLYPVKSGCTYSNTIIPKIWNYTDQGYGIFILGVVSKTPEFGSVRYYAMSSNRMENVIKYLLSDDLLTNNNFSVQDASLELQKSIIDPLQFIKSCVFLPCYRADIGSILSPQNTPVEIFNWEMQSYGQPILEDYVLPEAPAYKYTRLVTIPKHPQTDTRGQFVNQSPYTILTLMMPPFGVIDIDTTVTANATTLKLEIEIDLPTGLGIMTVSCNDMVLNRIEAQIGIPVQLSQITRDYVGGVTSIVNGVTGTVSSALFGDVGGAISSAVTGIGNAINSLAPRSQSIGSGGSYAQVDYQPKLQAQFFECVDDDIVRNGRPCCKIVNCEDALGYYLIQDGDVPINGTREEAQLVKTYLETGFYYE